MRSSDAAATQLATPRTTVEETPLTGGKALIVIPTYNERENIESLVRELLALPIPLAVLVIDDHSPDGTGAIVERLAEEFSDVMVLRRAGKMGIGSAYIEGFQYGLARGYEFIMTMDADFSHDPKRVPALIAAVEHADVAIGSRYQHGGLIQQWPWSRRLLSWGANTLVNVCLGLPAHDCTSGFRCYRRSILASLKLDQIKSQGYSCLVELLFACQTGGGKMAEVPIVFIDRKFGSTKISQREIYKGVWTLLRLGLRRWL